MNKTNELFFNLAQAKEYLGKIGKEDCVRSCGYLYDLDVQSTIYHQQYAGATNYHKNAAFDSALAKAIEINFNELSRTAIEIMQQEAYLALIAEEEELLKRLEKIRELKEKK